MRISTVRRIRAASRSVENCAWIIAPGRAAEKGCSIASNWPREPELIDRRASLSSCDGFISAVYGIYMSFGLFGFFFWAVVVREVDFEGGDVVAKGRWALFAVV